MAADGIGDEYSPGPPAGVRGGRIPGDALFGCGRSDSGVQHRADTDRLNVQYGDRTDDDVRLRLLSVERAFVVSDSAIRGPDQPAGVCERGPPRIAGAPVPAYQHAGRDRSAGADRRRSALSGAEEVSPEGG